MSFQRLVLMVGLLVLSGSLAHAQSADDVAVNAVKAVDGLPGLVSALAYLMGLLLGVLGVLKIKEHVEKGDQVPLRIGLIRLLIGGGLFALPTVYYAMMTLINGGEITDFESSRTLSSAIQGIIGSITSWEELPTIGAFLGRVLEGLNAIPIGLGPLSYLMGLVLGIMGLIKLKEHVENPDQVKLREPVIRFAAGGAMFALTTVYQAMNNWVSFDQGFIGQVTDVLDNLGLVISEWAVASWTGNAVTCMASGGVGSALCWALVSGSAFPAFLTALSYIVGLIFGFWAILKIKAHVENPAQTPVWEGVSRLFAGGLFLALPVAVSVVKTTLSPIVLEGARVAQGVATSYNEEIGNCEGLDGAVACMMNDIIGPTHMVLNLFAMTAGMIFLMIGISRLTKSAQDGARGPGGVGTFMTFVTAGALLSYNELVRGFTASMGLGSIFGIIPITATFAELQYTDGMTAAELAHAHTIISAIVKLMIVVGLISFVRGIFIVRSVAEGNGQASIMAGATHMIGGALAVNIGPLINLVQNTLGIENYGITFS